MFLAAFIFFILMKIVLKIDCTSFLFDKRICEDDGTDCVFDLVRKAGYTGGVFDVG